MASHDDVALEAEEEMLADRLDALEDAPVDGPSDAGHNAAWIRALRLDPLADEDLEPARDPVEAVAFRHVSRRAPTRARGGR
jgi:hypothetical protein